MLVPLSGGCKPTSHVLFALSACRTQIVVSIRVIPSSFYLSSPASNLSPCHASTTVRALQVIGTRSSRLHVSLPSSTACKSLNSRSLVSTDGCNSCKSPSSCPGHAAYPSIGSIPSILKSPSRPRGLHLWRGGSTLSRDGFKPPSPTLLWTFR